MQIDEVSDVFRPVTNGGKVIADRAWPVGSLGLAVEARGGRFEWKLV